MLILLIHFILCVSKHILIEKYKQYGEWPKALTVLYMGQRICKLNVLKITNLVYNGHMYVSVSPIYYYIYKRVSLLFLAEYK